MSMPKLRDLLKKAEEKGLTVEKSACKPSPFVLSPWQDESVLNNNESEKLEPNLSQSEAKVEPNLSQNLSQTKAKLEPKLSQSRAKLGTELEPQLEPKLSQSRAKVEPKITFSSLIGLQRNIVLFVYENCQNTLQQETDPLSVEHIAMQCESTKSAIRKAIQRLEEKGILLRASFKNGRGGWTKYALTDAVYQEILIRKNRKLEPNLSQTRAKVRTEPRTELEPNLSRRRSLDIKESSSIEDPLYFDTTPYEQYGFGQNQLAQIIQMDCFDTDQIKESLIHWKFDIENKTREMNSPLNYLMKCFRQQVPYTSDAYIKHEDKEISEMLRVREESRQKRQEGRFTLWLENLSEEEITKIEKRLPPSLQVLRRTYEFDHKEVREWLRGYYLSSSGKEGSSCQ